MNPRATHLLIRHEEISLKGRNRPEFERRLIKNLERSLGGKHQVVQCSGRFLVPLTGMSTEIQPLIAALARVSGVAAITPCAVVARELPAIQTEAVEWARHDLRKNPEARTLAVRTRRVDKTFSMQATENDKLVGGAIRQLNPQLTIDLKRPDLKISIEIRQAHALIYSEETAGMRGLPIDTTQRVVALLSGGIDSPVAVHAMMRRGCLPILVHFHSRPYTSEASINKVRRLAERLQTFSPNPFELWLVPLLDIQKAVRDHCQDRFRTIHYRRFMMRVAQELAIRRHAKALVTGDSLGQVASQTLANLAAIDDGLALPVLRPLISYDKAQIIAYAKKLGTYETSIEPHDDTCVLFAPTHPATASKPERLHAETAGMPHYDLIFSAADRAEKIFV